LTIDDPSHLLTWSSKERALVSFTRSEDFQHKQQALRKIIKQWTDYQAYLVATVSASA
jgi:hypothetical protein